MDSAAKDHGKGPKATPAVSGSVVFTLGISGILSAFGAESGAPRWRHDFTKEFPRTSPLYGSAASPLVSGQLCIVPIGGHDRGALRAFDAKTGEPRWSWNEDGPAYSSPVVGTLGGKRQVVVQMQNYILGVEAQSGTFLWKKPFRTAYDQNIVTPIILDDLVIHSGYQQPIEALRLRSEEGGQKLSVETAWQDKADSQFMSSAVTTEGLLFAHSHRQRGRILCRQARDGKLLWRGPERFGEQASLVLAGGFLLALNTEGVLTVLRAHDKGYEEVRKYDVADTPTWAHIAVAGRTLLVKDRNSLACLRIQ
jgi:outer membrane protein assembly factor BamB